MAPDRSKRVFDARAGAGRELRGPHSVLLLNERHDVHDTVNGRS